MALFNWTDSEELSPQKIVLFLYNHNIYHKIMIVVKVL